MLTALIGLHFTLRLPKTNSGKPKSAAKRVDVAGAILLLLSVTTPLIALNIGGQILPWSHPVEILLFLLTLVFVTLFYRVEKKVAITSTPIVPLRFVQSPAIMIVFACGLPAWFAWNQVNLLFFK
jgi:ABC-type transport system involved in cytochrome c biogenesis permease subunit